MSRTTSSKSSPCSAMRPKLLRAMGILSLASIGLVAQAGEQRATCNGAVGTFTPSGDTVWVGSWTYLNASGWQDVNNFIRNLSDGPVGQLGAGGNPGGNPDYSVCWSLNPFTAANTNNGETCTHEGPFAYTTGQTYYRMNIDRSVSPTVYCQVAMVTADTAPGRGNTFVVALAAGIAEKVPAMPAWMLGFTVAALGLFGGRWLRKS